MTGSLGHGSRASLSPPDRAGTHREAGRHAPLRAQNGGGHAPHVRMPLMTSAQDLYLAAKMLSSSSGSLGIAAVSTSWPSSVTSTSSSIRTPMPRQRSSTSASTAM